MDLRRRDFLAAFAAGATLAACGRAGSREGASPATPTAPPRGKKILILGGTGFAGPPIVETARARGHAVTMFNRGKTNPGLFPDVETILGDRMTELDRLKG